MKHLLLLNGWTDDDGCTVETCPKTKKVILFLRISTCKITMKVVVAQT